jgi:hypothetical protein
MIQKALACGSFSLAYALGFSQSLTTSELEVDQALKNLRPSAQALLRLTGAEYFGSTTTPIASDFFWDRPGITSSQNMKIELLEARNNVWTRRVVADGRHVWGVDLIKNTYSTSRYGSYTATKPTDYETNGFQSVNILASSQSAWQARLAREIWGGTDAMYRQWIPASTNRNEFTVTGGAAYADPVVLTRSYSSTSTKKFHIYWLAKAGVAQRSVTFELDQSTTTSAWNLTAVYFSDRTRVGAVDRLIDWKIDVLTTLPLPAIGNFVYTPPAGAKAIASPRPNGSG